MLARIALLREAEEYSALGAHGVACSGIAASLLAIKRLQITRYEALMAWSIECGFDEAVPLLRRALAEALVAAEALGTLAFGTPGRFLPADAGKPGRRDRLNPSKLREQLQGRGCDRLLHVEIPAPGSTSRGDFEAADRIGVGALAAGKVLPIDGHGDGGLWRARGE